MIRWYRDGRKCYWCGLPTRMVNGNAWDVATTDHVVPRCKGGTNDDVNLVSACRLYNSRRSYEDTKGLPEGSMLGPFLPRRESGGPIWIIDERRLPVSEERKKTTKELQEHTKALLEQGEKLKQESEKSLARLAMMVHSERISFTRTSPQRTRDMTILYDKLNDEQKRELERIDRALFDMADEVTEREKRTLKTSEEEASR